MDGLFFNKIAFCILATGLLLIGLNQASASFFPPEKHAKPGYFIEVKDDSAAEGPPVPEGPRDYGTLIAAATVDAGKTVAVKCQQCHSFDPGKVVTGPPLYGVVGRDVASVPGFKYTDAMKAVGGKWDYDRLDHFLQGPQKYVPGSAMTFVGLKKQEDRSAVMAYLRTLTTGEPLPLPAPLPPPEPAPAAPDATPAAAPANGGAPAASPGAAPASPAAAGSSPAAAPAGPTAAGPDAKPAPAPAPKPATPASSAPAKPAPASAQH